jgi:hypothetical protein
MKSLTTALLTFLVMHPIAGWIAMAAGVVIIWLQTKSKREWKKEAKKYQDILRRTQAELYETREQGQRLTAETERQYEQLTYKQLFHWFKLDNGLAPQWGLVGVNKVRKSSGYEPDEINEKRKSLGRKDNIFEPMPPPPIKRPATDADYEPAIVLAHHYGYGKFTVAVIRYADIDTFPDWEKVLAKVDVLPLNSKIGWNFDIPISGHGRGALSLALDYVLALAKAEQVPVLEAMFTHVEYEDHRIRLCNFYKRKYEFIYQPNLSNPESNGYITKYLK